MPSRRGLVILRAIRSLRHRGEVVVDHLALRLQAGLVPGRPELAAAADVGEHVDAAVLEPQLAGDRRSSTASSETWKPP